MKPALIVLDIQNEWLDKSPGLRKSVEKRADTINEAIGWFRRNGRPIIVVYHEDKEKGPVRGTHAFEVPDMIKVEATDIKVIKHHPDAFGQTDLEDVLQSAGCDAILITGLSAVYCVLGTFFGAMNWKVDPYILKGGVCADREEHVQFSEDVCEAITLQKLEEMLR